MENVKDLNVILDREKEAMKLKEILQDFELNKKNILCKRGIYIYGEPGTGKTSFVMNVLKTMDYDIIKYDAGDIRNKNIIEMIHNYNMSDRNIMSMFHRKIKKIVIVMDEIDGMNNGDKGGINSLIKLIRPKKTKKQKQENITMIPIVCIGNVHIDKKISELMKVCDSIHLNTPTEQQMNVLLNKIIHSIDPKKIDFVEKIVSILQGDLRKCNSIMKLFQQKPNILNNELLFNILQRKSYNDDTKHITQKLLNQRFTLQQHTTLMNETDRTIVGLLWHENIIDVFEKDKRNKIEKRETIDIYLKCLSNMTFADYIDRVTFQKQIWHFNEMSSLIKTLYNNKLYHDFISSKQQTPYEFKTSNVRFTKVLTKYSTEYNNSTFIQNLCQQLSMDKKDLFSFFLYIKNKYNEQEIIDFFETYDINKLDIFRIYRYLDKFIKEDAETIEDETIVEVYNEPCYDDGDVCFDDEI
jgi:DNA polymerase III delta prime subunit